MPLQKPDTIPENTDPLTPENERQVTNFQLWGLPIALCVMTAVTLVYDKYEHEKQAKQVAQSAQPLPSPVATKPVEVDPTPDLLPALEKMIIPLLAQEKLPNEYVRERLGELLTLARKAHYEQKETASLYPVAHDPRTDRIELYANFNPQSLVDLLDLIQELRLSRASHYQEQPWAVHSTRETVVITDAAISTSLALELLDLSYRRNGVQGESPAEFLEQHSPGTERTDQRMIAFEKLWNIYKNSGRINAYGHYASQFEQAVAEERMRRGEFLVTTGLGDPQLRPYRVETTRSAAHR